MTEEAKKPAKAAKRPEKAAAPEHHIKVTLVRSLVGYPRVQRETAKGLGLRKLRSHAVLKATPAALGMVRKIGHVLKVETVEKP
jgi:large subunit ribosomal protein L30